MSVAQTARSTRNFIDGASHEFGFIARFPSKVDVAKMQNALGPISSFMAFDDENGIFYQLGAHKLIAFEKLGPMTEEKTRSLVEVNFDSYCRESGAVVTSKNWRPISSWPVLEFTCEHTGFFGEGIKSYKRGYFFLKNGTYFKLIVHGFSNDDALEKAGLKFFASFSFATPELIDAAVKVGALSL
jgi:hypothetical protein